MATAGGVNVRAVMSWRSRRIVIRNAGELEAALDRVSRRAKADAPALLQIECAGQDLTVGLGPETAFVQCAGVGGQPPYLAAMGDLAAEGEVVFVLDGLHHTEIPARHVVSTAVAKAIVRDLVETGERPATVEWGEM